MQQPNNTATLRELYSRKHVLTSAGARVQIKELRRQGNTSHYELIIENRQTASGGSDVAVFVRVMGALAAADALAALADGNSGQVIYPGQTKIFTISADVQSIWFDARGLAMSDFTTEAAATLQVTLTEEVPTPLCPPNTCRS